MVKSLLQAGHLFFGCQQQYTTHTQSAANSSTLRTHSRLPTAVHYAHTVGCQQQYTTHTQSADNSSTLRTHSRLPTAVHYAHTVG
jgi:argonaute-like protein implicated in RNA metabolism and viral defense